MGKQQNHGGESFTFKPGGKHTFLASIPSTLAGNRFSGVVTGGCLKMIHKISILIIFEALNSVGNMETFLN